MRGNIKKRAIETRLMMFSIKFIFQLWDRALNIWLAQIFLFSLNGKHSDKWHLHKGVLWLMWKSWKKQTGGDECDHLREYPAVGKVVADLIREAKAGSYDICQGLKLSFFFTASAWLHVCLGVWLSTFTQELYELCCQMSATWNFHSTTFQRWKLYLLYCMYAFLHTKPKAC